MIPKKIALYWVLSAILGFIIGLSVNNAEASTVYSTAEPTSSQSITMTGGCCSGADNYKVYNVNIKPTGVTFDRVLLAGSIVSGSPEIVIFKYRESTSTEDYPYNAFTGNVTNLLGFQNDVFLSSATVSLTDLGNGTILSGAFSPMTVNSGEYISIYLTNGSFSINRQVQNSTGNSFKSNESSIPSPFTIYSGGQALHLCNGACDTSTFNPLPQVTASPWIRILQPINEAFVGYDVPFTIQANTGTTSADNIVVEFSSNYQSITPYTADLTTTGVNEFNFTQSFPVIDDDVTIVAKLYASTTLIATSTTVLVHTRANITEEDVQRCEGYNFVLTGLCNLMVFLFVPSDTALDFVSDIWNNVADKPPFGYVTILLEQMEAFETEGTAVFDFGDIPFMSTVFDPLRTAVGGILWAIYAIYFYRHRLTQLDI